MRIAIEMPKDDSMKKVNQVTDVLTHLSQFPNILELKSPEVGSDPKH